MGEQAALRIDPRTRPPRAWAAALMTLAVLGLGHFYAGAWKRALAVWGLGVVLLGMAPDPASPAGVDGVLTTVAVGAAYLSWAMLDAAAAALRCPRRGLRRYNRWYVYVAVGSAALAVAVAVLSALPEGPAAGLGLAESRHRP